MTSIYGLKGRFQSILRPLVRHLAGCGITANQVTLAALLISLLVGSCIAAFPQISGLWLLLPLTMFIRMALNAIDGMLAREHNMKTALGALLNELGDVVSDIALYLPFMTVAGPYSWLVAVMVTLAITTEMTGVVAVQIGAPRRYDGPMGKSDRAFVFGTAGLAIGLGFSPEAWLPWVLSAVVFLLVWTIINRAKNALKECNG